MITGYLNMHYQLHHNLVKAQNKVLASSQHYKHRTDLFEEVRTPSDRATLLLQFGMA